MPPPQELPNWIKKCPLPWVVVDLSVLRGWKACKGLPGKFTAIIPDILLTEIVGSTDPEGSLNLFNSILRHPNAWGRVLIGRYWDDINSEELTPSDIYGGKEAAVHPDLSSRLRDNQIHQRDAFPTPDEWPDLTDSELKKSLFIKLCQKFSRRATERFKSEKNRLSSGDLESRIEELNSFKDGMPEAVEAMLDGPLSAEWKEELRSHPNRSARGRYVKLVQWYALTHACAPDTNEKNLGNNWDDHFYVFLAQYTGHLLTKDKGMTEAARAVAGENVQVHSSSGAISSG